MLQVLVTLTYIVSALFFYLHEIFLMHDTSVNVNEHVSYVFSVFLQKSTLFYDMYRIISWDYI